MVCSGAGPRTGDQALIGFADAEHAGSVKESGSLLGAELIPEGASALCERYVVRMFGVSGPKNARIAGVTASIVGRIELNEPNHAHTPSCELAANKGTHSAESHNCGIECFHLFTSASAGVPVATESRTAHPD